MNTFHTIPLIVGYMNIYNNKFLLLHLDIDDCIGQTCSGNGQCNDLINGFECECKEGFEGNLCESSKLSGLI